MGSINVFSGPMKSGKSQRLINEANRYRISGQKIQVFKPIIDDRYSEDEISDRNGNKIPAINIEKIEDIEKYDADVYFIDEFQFLKGDIDSIQKLAGIGKKFFIAGLNLTAEKKPFGKMGELLCNSDNVQMMTAICECCHQDNAIYTYCKFNKTSDILVGDSQYLTVCPSCYNKLTLEKNNNN